MICQKEEREAGRAYPRTCPTCRLGPCQKVGAKHLQALADAQAEIARLTAERDEWVEMARLHSAAESSFLAWLRSAGEHMRAFGITICDDGSDAGEVLAAKVPECAKAMAARITDLETERDEALARAAAAAMEMRERAAAVSGHYMSDEVDELLLDIWREDIRALPIDTDAQKALDKMLAKAREDAIREAAHLIECDGDALGGKPGAAKAILALLNDGGRDE